MTLGSPQRVGIPAPRALLQAWLVSALVLALLLPMMQLAANGGQTVLDRLASNQTATTTLPTTTPPALEPVASAVGSTPTLSFAGDTWSATVSGGAASVVTAAGPVTLRTSTIAGGSTVAATAVQTPDGLTIDHGVATEWWRQVDHGLEQGWTFAAEPIGSAGQLTVDVGVDGFLIPTLLSDTAVRLVGDGQTLLYSGLAAWDATGRDLPATMSVDGMTINIAVDAAGATYPVTIDPILQEDDRLVATDTSAQDNWGAAVAIDGQNALSVAPGEDRTGRNQGIVVFMRDDDLTDDPAALGQGFEFDVNGVQVASHGPGAEFGASADIASETGGDERAIALIGAPGDDTNGVDAGSVSVFYRRSGANSTNGWVLDSTIYACVPVSAPAAPPTPCDPTIAGGGFDGARFGAAVDADYPYGVGSGFSAIIGAPGQAGGGAVYYVGIEVTGSGPVNEYNTRYIVTPPANTTEFGSSVASRWGAIGLADDYIVIGANTPGAPAIAGYVFRNDNGVDYVQSEQLDHIAGGSGPGRVAVANDMVAIATDQDPFGSPTGLTQVFVNAFDDDIAVPLAASSPWQLGPGAPQFGGAVDFADVDGDQTVLAIGQPENGPNSLASLYEITASDPGGTTQQLPEFETAAAGDGLGLAIATDGLNWIVGAPFADGSGVDAGLARLGALRLFNDTNIVDGGPLDDGPAVGVSQFANSQLNRFGAAVAISGSSDGSLLAVGAPDRDSNGELNGTVAIYERTGGAWDKLRELEPQLSTPVDGVGFGYDVAVSGDRIAIGTAAGALPGVNTASVWDESLDVYIPINGLDPAETASDYGRNVAISGDWLVVSGADPNPETAPQGRTLVFKHDGGAPGQYNLMTNIGEVFAGTRGFSADIAQQSADQAVIVIGEPAPDGGGPGQALVYTYNSSSSLLTGPTIFPGLGTNGSSVAIDQANPTSFVMADPTSGRFTLITEALAFTPTVYPYDLGAFETGFAAAPPNGYVDVHNDVVVVANENIGGQVDVFQVQGGILVATDQVIPAAGVDPVVQEDHVGWSVSLAPDGALAFGAPDYESVQVVNQAGAAYTVNNVIPAGPADNPVLAFQFGLADPGQAAVAVAGGISASDFDARTIAAVTESSSSIGAAPLNAVELADTPLNAVAVSGSPLGSISLDEFGLIDIIRESPELQAIPLVDISIDGGWEAVIAGNAALAAQPINNLTLGDVIDGASAESGLAATRLGSIDVNGTPLNAVPLNAVALGATPLNAVPLNAVGETVASVCGSIPGCDGTTTVLEASLRGAPLNAVPLNAVPLNAVDLADTPLNAVPLNAVDLEQSPLNAVPLNAVDLAGTALGSIPLNAVPLNAVPLNAVPLNAVPLNAVPLNAVPLNAVPLNAVPLNAVPLNAVPLNAVGAESTPLNAVPLNAVVLADLPLNAVPLNAVSADPGADWCELLAAVGSGYDCDGAVDPAETTIFDLMVQSVPLNAVPLNAVPLNAVDVDGIPLNAVPLNAVPLNAVPLNAVPLNAVPLNAVPLNAVTVNGTPLNAVPLNAVDIHGSPLNAVPLNAVPLNAVPLNAVPLNAVPLNAVPLNAVPLNAVTVDGAPLNAVPLNAVDITGSPLNAVPLNAVPLNAVDSFVDCDLVDCRIATLGDAVVAGAADALLAQPLDAIEGAFVGLRYSDLLVALGVADSAIDFSGTVGSITDASEMVLGDLVVNHPGFNTTTLGDLQAALYAVTFADLSRALGVSFSDVQTAFAAYTTANPGATLADLLSYGDVTLGDLLTQGDLGLTLEDLGRILGLVNVEDFLTAYDPGALVGDPQLSDLSSADPLPSLGDLTPEQRGDMTLFDLIGTVNFDALTLEELFDILQPSGALDGYTFGDLLLALVAADELPFDGLNFADVDSGALPSGVVPDITFEAIFEVQGSLFDQSLEITADLPTTASYVPGSARYVAGNPPALARSIAVRQAAGAGEPFEPSVTGNRLTWTVDSISALTEEMITFDVRPEVSLGSSEVVASGRIFGVESVATELATVAVAEGLEPNDYPATSPAVEGSVYLTYITSGSDIDVFEVSDLGENDQLFVELSSLDADLDLAVYVIPDDGADVTALSGVSDEAPLIPITDPDADAADSEPLQDFPRLDLLYPGDGLELLEVSNSAGTATETIATGRLIAGTYYVQVFGANGATNTNPAVLQIDVVESEIEPDCAALYPLANPPAAIAGIEADLSGTPNTAFLVNYQRLEQLYSGADRVAVQASLDDMVTYLTTDPIGSTLGIDPVVIPVDAYSDVRDAYTAWDTDPAVACDPAGANAIVDQIITNAIDPIRSSLDHIVVIGDDAQIPMARLADATSIANEYDFRHEFDGDGTGPAGTIDAFTSTFWDRVYLSDEPYGESAARDLGGRYLYVSDIALGRVVETPLEIIAQLSTFQTFDGELDITTGEVLGYDFLSDGSAEIGDDLAAALGAPNVETDLADGYIGDPSANEPWTSLEAIDALISSPADIVSLNAHFDHYRALPADEGTLLETGNVLTGIEVDIVFSMGCHGGLAVSDIRVGATNADWAQTFAQNQTVFIGNTGFGYGDTETVAYTERLLALFAEEVVRPFGSATEKTTIGEALTFAKNRYVGDVSTFSVYDEKALMEATFYGLPFYTVGIAGEDLPAPPTNVVNPDSTGLETLTVGVAPDNTPQVTDLGTFYSNPDGVGGDPQVVSVPGYPVQPSLTSDISVVDGADPTALALEARGAIVTGMTSEYLSNQDPVVAGAIFDEVASEQGEPELGDVVFPAKPLTINTVTTPGGQRQTLVTATGQFASTSSTTGTQRLDDSIDVVVYYAAPGDPDNVLPTIGTVDSTLTNEQLTVTVEATDAGGSVERVLVLVAPDPGVGSLEWIPVDLQQVGGGSSWAGSQAITATEVEFLVQVVDSSGNVGVATNKARNFNDDGEVEPEPPTPDLDAAPNSGNLDAPTGWYTGPATIDVAVTNGAAEYSVDGAAFVPLVGTQVTVTGDGIHTWEVRLTDQTQPISGIVRIDTTGAPVIEIAPPADGATYAEDTILGLQFLCTDPSRQTCDAQVDGAPASLNDLLPMSPGTHAVTVIGEDVFGNTASLTHTYTVEAVGGPPPVILDASVENIAGPGEETDVYVEFSGEPGVTATIDWGDSTSSVATVTDPTATEPGMAEGGHTYAQGGVYTITVTLTSPSGTSASTTLTTLSCTHTGTSGNDYMVGTIGDDVLCGFGGADRIYGLRGNDIIYGGAGRDRLYGNSGADVIYGGRDRDIIYGGGQDDLLIGGEGNDYINGQSGNDILRGRLGPDALIGGSGDDELYGNRGDDYISGQSGNDYARGGQDNDLMFGSGGNDELRGNAGADRILGGGGDDTLAGGAGDDRLYGQSGADDLDGGAATDLCNGGGGANTFVNCE